MIIATIVKLRKHKNNQNGIVDFAAIGKIGKKVKMAFAEAWSKIAVKTLPVLLYIQVIMNDADRIHIIKTKNESESGTPTPMV